MYLHCWFWNTVSRTNVRSIWVPSCNSVWLPLVRKWLSVLETSNLPRQWSLCIGEYMAYPKYYHLYIMLLLTAEKKTINSTVPSFVLSDLGFTGKLIRRLCMYSLSTIIFTLEQMRYHGLRPKAQNISLHKEHYLSFQSTDMVFQAYKSNSIPTALLSTINATEVCGISQH